ncbi:hypothetical protein [Almyronema epifaneia]|uniref:Hydrocarbon-binding protein n=1 Tax=Almyronema epifaneia S1 TaxID=2991925 RepID=A0ABW6IDA2_9CYAN
MSISIENDLRSELGDFSSIVCFKAVVTGIQEALGEKAALIALVSAGRQRGKQLIEELGLANGNLPLPEVAQLMQKILGKDGTRLCLIDAIEECENGFRVACRETICSSGEAPGSPITLSYTLGALQGALEAVTGKRLRGKQVESVLRGSSQDVVEFAILG